MKCPKCESILVKKFYKGMMEVDSCPNCRGMWLDSDELDRLEDVTFDQDEYKGSLLHRETETSFLCPHCETKLQEFQYRLYSLKLDTCQNRHGFWLDAGEDVRVMGIMAVRAAEIERKVDAESEWRGILQQMHAFLKR
ncbi:MAG: zf-TFIIB domain-containing protein [Anaerolineales bacterium]